MTNKTYFWSYRDVTDFLRENDFDFMDSLDDSKGAWVKLENSGDPSVMLVFKFIPNHYSKREINRIIRLSKIPENKWMEWAEARLNEAAP